MSAADPAQRPVMDAREEFPGEEVVTPGLADLAAGRETANALLVAAAAPRLRRAGIAVPAHTLDTTGRRLFALLEQEFGNGAHSRYNALQRRVISYCVARTQDARRRG